MVSGRTCVIALVVMVVLGALFAMLYIQMKMARDIRSMLVLPAHHSPNNPPTAATPSPPRQPHQQPPQQPLHSANLLKSLLTTSTLSSVVDLCKYKSEVGALGSLDSDLQRIQDEHVSKGAPEDTVQIDDE